MAISHRMMVLIAIFCMTTYFAQVEMRFKKIVENHENEEDKK